LRSQLSLHEPLCTDDGRHLPPSALRGGDQLALARPEAPIERTIVAATDQAVSLDIHRVEAISPACFIGLS
jgi:hypothetical protein